MDSGDGGWMELDRRRLLMASAGVAASSQLGLGVSSAAAGDGSSPATGPGTPLFEDDFSENTLDEYDVRHETNDYMGQDGQVTYADADDWLLVTSPNNIWTYVGRSDVDIPTAGHGGAEIQVMRDYHVSNRFGVRLVEDEDNYIEWRASANYGDSIRVVEDGETVLTEEGEGALGPDQETHVVDVYWTADAVALHFDGEESLQAAVDTTGLDPGTFELVNSQGDTRLRAARVTDARASSAPETWTVEQGGDRHTVEPLGYDGQTIESFYSYGDPDGSSANTPTNLEERGVSKAFLYSGPDGVSLGFVHDEPDDKGGGSVTFEFDTLPDDGSWVVEDDSWDQVYSHTRAVWNWNPCCTDGGAFRGGLETSGGVTITPQFTEGIDTWEFLSGDPAAPDRIPLDTSQPVTISPGPGDGEVCGEDAPFCDDWSDGDYTSSPPWEIYLDEGDFRADVRAMTGVPRGGPNALHVSETTGGGTDGVIGWQNGLNGWDGEWTIRGLFHTTAVNTSIQFQAHDVFAYYDGDGDSAPIELACGFTDPDANLIDFHVGGELIQTVETASDVDWAEDTWYHYELVHDGDGRYTGRLWVEGSDRPTQPDATSVGEPPGSEARVAAIDVNGAPGSGEDDLAVSHSYMQATGQLRREVEEEPEVLDATLPPTAVEPSEAATLSVEVDPGSLSAEQLTFDPIVTVRHDSSTLNIVEAETTAFETDKGTVVFESTLPRGQDLRGPTHGIELAVTAPVRYDGNGVTGFVEGPTTSTFVARDVDTVGLVAAHPDGSDPDVVNDLDTELFDEIRDKAEFLNRYYASGLGSMGGQGFDVQILNREFDQSATNQGWLELSEGAEGYGNGLLGKASDLTSEALQLAEDELGRPLADEIDTGFVVSDSPDDSKQYGDAAFYSGRLLPESTDIVLEFGEVGVDIATARLLEGYGFDDVFPETGELLYELDSGDIDAVYCPLGKDAWRHEFGHACGPGNEMGLPDLYFTDSLDRLTFGTIQGWGLMGTKNVPWPYASMCGFSRSLGGELWNQSEQWLDGELTVQTISDETIGLTPLTEKELGDSIQYVLSAFGEVNVDLDYGFFKGVTVDVSLENFKVLPYLIEARKSGRANIEDAFSEDQIPLSPSLVDGIALYRFGLLELGDLGVLEEFFDPDRAFEIENPEVLDFDFITQDGQIHPDSSTYPSLSKTAEDRHESLYDPVTATEFEMVEGFPNPSVELQRGIEDFVDSNIPWTDTILAEFQDTLEGLLDELPSGGEPLPPLDVLVETADGRHVGTDPATGEVVNEIDGARVFSAGDSVGVVVPGADPYDVTISDERLRAALEDRGYTPPDGFEYEQTVIVDSDTTIEDRGGYPYMPGRTRQRVQTSTAESAGAAVATTGVSFRPPTLNSNSRGTFVTAHLEVPDGHDPENLHLETVLVRNIQAVTDDTYGFVKNPPTRTEGDTTYVLVKFPREEVIEAFGTGEHEPVVTGIFGDTSVQALGELTIRDSPSGGGNST